MLYVLETINLNVLDLTQRIYFFLFPCVYKNLNASDFKVSIFAGISDLTTYQRLTDFKAGLDLMRIINQYCDEPPHNKLISKTTTTKKKKKFSSIMTKYWSSSLITS